jgi:hypothetical protein
MFPNFNSGLYALLWKSQNPLLNDGFTGRNTIGGMFGFGGSTVEKADAVYSTLTDYANTAIHGKAKDPFAPVAGPVPQASLNVNPPGQGPQPPPNDGACNICNVIGLQ